MHVALQHAPQLRNFIQPGRPQKLAYSRDPGIVVSGPSRTRVSLRILTHGAEFIASKLRIALAHTFLPDIVPDPESPTSPRAK